MMADELEDEQELDALDYVDHCMNDLGISLNLTDPTSNILSSKKDINEYTVKMWDAVREDYRKLSDAILALREDNSQDLAQKILNIIREATERANKVSETFAVDNMLGALNDIEKLCKEQLKEDK